MGFFRVSSEVVDRDDLSVYEKMCCVVLAKFFQEDIELTMEDIARSMNVEPLIAKGAFYSLKRKGILESSSPSVKAGTIIKAEQAEKLKPHSYDDKVQQVFEIIDEKINEREAKIILNFAENNVERVKEKYMIAKSSQYQDKIEVLIHELQKKPTSRIIKKEAMDETVKVLEDFSHEEISEKKQSSQVNTYKINLMKKYQKK